MSRPLFSCSARVRLAVNAYLAAPEYGKQKCLAYEHGIPPQTLSQAIGAAKRNMEAWVEKNRSQRKITLATQP